jgi:ATPase
MKTIESPRDLNLPKQVTQYSLHYSTHSEIRDILLLSRPDYSILDEIRNTEDFLLYKDLRLTGIGLIGVIHATKPVDAVQRLMSSVDI